MTDAALAAPPRPYKGLAAFADSELDALLFFGREREIEVIAANLIAARLTVLYGPSGVGKTSLVRAGVAHRLRREGEAIVVFSGWSGDPVDGLLEAVEAEVRRVAPETANPPPGAVADTLSTWARRLGADFYVVLDQLEEYFLYHADDGRAGALTELAEVVRQPDARVHLLLSIREDALAQLDAFKTQLPGLFGNSLRLDRLDRTAATRAILGPLERYNELVPADETVEAENQLVDEILDSVTAGRIQLGDAGRGGADEGGSERGRIETPYLQLVLDRLWEVETEGGSRRLRVATLRELGGATRIVEDHLERAMASLSPIEKDAAAAMYNHLVTPSGTKIAHRAGDLARYAAVDEGKATRVLERLATERIVRVGEDGAAGPKYEIFHDVLADAVLAWRTRHEADRRLEQERLDAARRQRRLLVASGLSLVAVAVLAAIAVYALSQRSSARESAREARAGELVALAAASLPTDPEQSLAFALHASRIARSSAVEDILRKTLKALRAKAVIPLASPRADATLSSDGEQVASVGGDGVRLYADNGRASVRRLRHPKAGAASFSEDGSRIATAGRDGVARIWEVRSGRLLRSLRHPGAVDSASFSRDGRRLLTVAENRVVRVFDAGTGKLRLRFVQPSRVMAARFSPRSNLIATGGSDDVARLWDARTGMLLRTLEGHVGRVGDVAFSPDGRLLATGSTDGTARVWRTGGSLITILPGHENFVSRVEFSPDGTLIATASRDRRARVFDAESPTLRATLQAHREAVSDVSWSRDGATLATASTDGTVRLWDPLPFPELQRVGQHSEPVIAVGFGADGRIVSDTARAEDPRIAARRRLVEAIARVGSTTAVALNEEGSLAVSGHEDGSTRAWDAETGRHVRELTAHRARVTSATFAPDGHSVVTTSLDHDARLSDVETGEQRWVLSHAATVSDADFSADGRWVVIAGPGHAGVVNASSGERMLLLKGKDRLLTAAAFSPKGWRIATGGLSGTVRAYNCRLCGGIHELVELAESRLAQLSQRS